MNRLQAEFHRLYLPLTPAVTSTDTGPARLTQPPDDTSRALVLELAQPADWSQLSLVWRGVQTDLDLPAPAIAVSGTEGLQLWFSLCEPVSLVQAHAFLEALRCHYLPDVAAQRVRLMPVVALSPASENAGQAAWVPALQVATGNWSAFVAPDLAPLFSETPWLDVQPGDDGQAKLLRELACIKPPVFAAALAQLRAAADQARAEQLKAEAGTTTTNNNTHASPVPVQTRAYGEGLDPRRFLLAVMNDEGAALALRVEAAKALLPYTAEVPTRHEG